MLLTPSIGRLVEPMTGRAWEPPEIVSRVHARIAEYEAVGLAPHDRVFLQYGNTLEFFIDVLAVWFLGGCVVPIDGRLTSFEVLTLARAARPRVAVSSEGVTTDVADALRPLGVVCLTMQGPTMQRCSEPRARGLPRLDDEALILFTSGTTGEPKGVVHTHRSLRARWSSLAGVLGLEPFRRTLCLLPTHFGHGLICNCLFPWLHGQDLYMAPPFRADILIRLGEIIDEHGITFLSSVPTVWRLAIKTAKPPRSASLSQIFCGSAPLSGSLWRSIKEWSGTRLVMNAYGITETGSWLAGTSEPRDEHDDGLVGVAWGGVLRVLRGGDASTPPSRAQDCAPGESGHIWVSTPALMKGYLDRSDLTSEVVSEGWFSTGDIGLLDDRGYLYLRGREREEINKGGMKVYPGDVDAVIERFPATVDVCTFAQSDALLGEEVGVAVVLNATDDGTLVALHRWSAAHLAAHQLPKLWYVLDGIPRTSRGKVNRSFVAAQCERHRPVPFAELLAQRA